MKLHVKNFGPIREAKVEIRPMTVLVGHSNTGKSYLAMLVYSIIKSFGSTASRKLFLGMFPGINLRAEQKEIVIDENDIEKFLEAIDIRIVISIGIRAYLDHIKRMWARQAAFCFGEEWKKNVKQKEFSLVITDEINAITFDLLSDKDQFKVPEAFIDRIIMVLKVKLEERLEEKLKEKKHRFPIRADVLFEVFDNNSSVSILNIIMDSFNFFPFDPLSDCLGRKKQNKMHYLPAGRGVIMENHLSVVNSIIHNVAAVYFDKPPFNGVTADFCEDCHQLKIF